MHLAIVDLEEFYDDFEADFLVFFEDLRQFATHKLTELEDLHS
jgi:acyl carrier protein phosphodiesterase